MCTIKNKKMEKCIVPIDQQLDTHVLNKFQKGYCKQVNQAGPMCPPKGLPVSEQCILNALSLPALSSHSQLSENNIAVTRPAWAVVYCFLGSR